MQPSQLSSIVLTALQIIILVVIIASITYTGYRAAVRITRTVRLTYHSALVIGHTAWQTWLYRRNLHEVVVHYNACAVRLAEYESRLSPEVADSYRQELDETSSYIHTRMETYRQVVSFRHWSSGDTLKQLLDINTRLQNYSEALIRATLEIPTRVGE